MKTAMMQLLDRLNEKKDNSDWFHIDEITQVVMDEMAHIEKQQIINDFGCGVLYGESSLNLNYNAEQYYNETYGDKKE